MTPRIGFFGKLPGYGDFVDRNLPRVFVELWDQWLQQAVQDSRQMLGEHWLEHYLTAPIWRFALSSGCIDGQAWLGLVLPSVDRVGRYFPLTLALPLPNSTRISAALCQNSAWFQQLEQIALACLKESPTVEAVVAVLDGLAPPQLIPWQLRQAPGQTLGNCVSDAASGMEIPAADMSLQHCLALTETLLRQQHPSFSLWYTGGGENSPNMLFSSESLPNPHGFTAMLTGQWHEYGWNVIC